MSLKILKPSQQSFAHYDEGRVRERKPVALPNEDGGMKGYSNLYYWAQVWSDEGGLVSDHTHKGFEMLTYVLAGKLEHYDMEKEEWKTLEPGAFQVMRAGSGLNHQERYAPGTRILQIALDPDLRKSLQKDPLTMDFYPDEFEWDVQKDMEILDFTHEDSEVMLSTPVRVMEAKLKAGATHKVPTQGEIFSGYVFGGKVTIDNEELEDGDFFFVKDRKEVIYRCEEDASVFMVLSPTKPQYRTYITQLQLQA